MGTEDDLRYLREEIRRLSNADKELEAAYKQNASLITDLRLLVTELRGLVHHMDKSIAALDVDNRLKVLERQKQFVDMIKWGSVTVVGGALTVIASIIASRVMGG